MRKSRHLRKVVRTTETATWSDEGKERYLQPQKNRCITARGEKTLDFTAFVCSLSFSTIVRSAERKIEIAPIYIRVCFYYFKSSKVPRWTKWPMYWTKGVDRAPVRATLWKNGWFTATNVHWVWRMNSESVRASRQCRPEFVRFLGRERSIYNWRGALHANGSANDGGEMCTIICTFLSRPHHNQMRLILWTTRCWCIIHKM